jgi:hypothetical protein
MNDGRSNRREWCPLGPIFRNISWPSIRKARVSDIGFSQDELDQFFRGLGFGLESLALVSFQLRSGSWVDAIDMLHEKVAVRYATQEFFFHFADMTGGEFGGGKKTVDITTALMMGYTEDETSESTAPMGRKARKKARKFSKGSPSLLDLTKQYITGEGVRYNPLRPAT